MKLFVFCFVTAGLGLASALQGECPPVDGESPLFLADGSDNSVYYVCSRGTPIKMFCPAGTVFDLEQSMCIGIETYAPVGKCPAVDGQYPTYLPDSESKKVFYECNNGKPIKMVCPDHTIFDPEKNVCVHEPKCLAEGGDAITLLPDEDNCSTFYVCSSGTLFLASCQGGMVFNPATKSCDYEGKSPCPRIEA